MTFARKLTAASTFALMVGASGAMAVPLNRHNIGFTWENPVGGQNIEYSGLGTGDAQIRWGGSGASFNDKSGYRIQAAGDPVPANPGVGTDIPFILGTFTHFNEPITAGTATGGVDLLVSADVFDNGVFQQAVQFEFEFEHLETTNSTPCNETSNPIGTVCDDRVTVSLVNVTDSFVSSEDGLLYTLDIEGFLQGGSPSNQFFSGEGGTNSADVQAVFTVAPVPLPAAGWLLLGGLGGLAALRRRQKKAA